jgi:hypothetical protein
VDLHELARQVAAAAGAEFAFVLSQAGLLVTHDAPRDMPERGRRKILGACPNGKNGEVAHLELARQDLVPFGGAAPIDVFAMRVEDAAILVIVLASWNNKGKVVLALTEGAAQLTELIHKARKVRAQKNAGKKPAEVRKEKPAAPPEVRPRITVPFEPTRRDRASAAPAEAKRDRVSAVPAPAKRDRPSAVPAEAKRDRASAAPVEVKRDRASAAPVEVKRDRASAALVEVKRDRASAVPAPAARRERTTLPFEPARRERVSAVPKAPVAVKKPVRPRLSSEPEIVIGEAEVGRETMLALEPFRPRPSSEPEIVLGEAPVGRETLLAIEAELPRSRPGPAPDAFRVELASISRESMNEVERIESSQRGRPTVDEPLVTERRTLPWVDTPAALKRTIEARELARGAAPPEVKLGVEEIDADLLEQALRDGK